MLLSVLMPAQLVFDAIVLGLVLLALARRRPPAKPAPPPAWHGELLRIAADVTAALDLALDELEARATSPRAGSAPAEPATDRHRRALGRLRDGMAADDVARAEGLLPAEVRLLRNVAAAEARDARTR